MRIHRTILALSLLAASLLAAGPASAQIRPSAQVLVPYFAVDLANPQEGDGTLFAVCNHGPEASEVVFTVFSNWGIPVLETRKVMQGDEVVAINLRDWIVYGALLERSLTVPEIEHLKAVLSGKPSPQDGLYFGTEIEPDLAVGYVTVRTVGAGRRPSLWGDFFTVRPEDAIFQGDTLVNIDRGQACPREPCNVPCKELGVRFLEREDLDTHLVIWSEKHGIASTEPVPPEWARLRVVVEVYDQAGEVVDERVFSLLPVQVMNLGELVDPLPVDFGWLEIELDVDGFVGVDFNLRGSTTAGLHAYCLPAETPAPGAKIRLEKLVNGLDADQAPGAMVDVASLLVWTYEVTNVGSEPLWGVGVEDEGVAVPCPADALEPGESFVCTSEGPALGCQRSNTARATGIAEGGPVDDTDSAFYYGQYHPALGISGISVNGFPADVAPGPGFVYGTLLSWQIVLTNTGDAPLTNVAVSAGFPVSCPATELQPGSAMTCTGSEPAGAGRIEHTVLATGDAPCDSVATQGTANAFVTGELPTGLTIVKLTNGEDVEGPTGPIVRVGSTVQWRYVVTNGSQVPLVDLVVTDNRLAGAVCAIAALAVGESTVCTAEGVALAGQYSNTGTVTGETATGETLSDSDPSWYFGISPAIRVEKLVNGNDADVAPGPVVTTGGSLLWTYVVVNTGDYRLRDVTVTDDQGLPVTCPKTVLQPGESMTCTANSTAETGAHANVATASGRWNGETVEDTDPAHYTGQYPAIRLEKRVNAQAADTPPGPTILVGATVSWTYVVTNSGDVALTNVAVTDDQGVLVTCPKATLEPDEAMVCTASGTAVAGQYANVGTATGTPPSGPAVTASDPAHYWGAVPGLTIQKLTNGEEADTPPGPAIPVGQPVLWTYVVTNTGDIRLTSVAVTDNRGVTVACPKTMLEPGESMTCTASGTAVAGQYANVGTASGTPSGGSPITATDPSHYLGQVLGNQGCAPGYWKNHTDSWPPTGYSPTQKVKTAFPSVTTFYPALGEQTLLTALGFAGGPGGEGAAEILLRAAVAALLNASHPDVAYPRTPASVIGDVNGALLQNRDAMLALAAALDADNNRGCPLN